MLMLIAFNVGNVWAAEEVAYTLDGTQTGGTNGYATESDITQGTISWKVTGNTTTNPWRIGGNSLTGIDRTIYSTTAMSDAITKVEISVGAASNITVNTLTLIVASDAEFNTVIDEVSETFAASSTITFAPTSPATQWATGAYYKFVFNVSVSGTKNKFVEFTRAKFYKEATKTLSSITISGTLDKDTYEEGDFFEPAGLVATGNYSDDSHADLTSSVEWAYTPAGALTQGLTSVNVTATKGTVSSAATPVAITVTAAPSKSTLDFTEKYATGGATADDGAEWIVTSDGTESNFDNTSGIHYGTNSANVTYIQLATSDISGTISKVVVNARDAQATATISVTVGGTAFTCSSGATATNTSTNYTFTGTGSGEIVVRIDRSSNMTKAIYCKSIVVSYEAVAVAVEKPTFSLATGTYLGAQSVEINCATVGADIYYTLDGTDPSSASTPYSSAISITETKTLKAIAIKGSDESAIASATYTIVITEHAGTKVDPYSVADAVKVIDVLGTQDGVYVSGIVSQIVTAYNSTYGNITFNISADGATGGQQFQAYRCKSFSGANFSSADDVVVGATAVVYGNLKKHNSTYELDADCYLAAYEAPTTPKTSIANDKDHPYTVAQAITYAADGITYDLDDYVYVSGVVYDVKNFNSTNGTLDIYIKDAGESNQFELYKCAGINDGSTTTSFDALTDVQVDDEVIAYGQLTVYGGLSELKQGNYLVSLNRPNVPVASIDLTESTAIVEEGKTVTLHASVLPNNATDQDIVWTVVSGDTYASVDNGVVTGIAAGEAVIRAASHEEASIYAECTVTVTEPAPLSSWATIYSSNVAMVNTGSGVDNGTITIGTDEPYLLVKAGAGSNTGTIEVTIPAQTHTLHFHAFAWGGKTAKIQIAGVDNPSVTEFDLAGESGASGSGNDFTLAGDPIDQYFSVTFDAVATETIITFSKATGSADNRFFLYGVNQEGGVLPVLDRIEISGDLDNKTYEAGDAIDMTGLTVNAIYKLAGVDQTPIDITSEVEWTYSPLVTSQTAVDITATYEEKTDTKTIEGLTVTAPTPTIYVSPSLTVNFGNAVPQNSSVADETIDVTLTAVTSATLVYSGDDVFSIDKTSLTESGTITISANTAAEGTFTGTITISDDAEFATSKVVTVKMKVVKEEIPVSTTTRWSAATDADIFDGAEVLITGVKDAVVYASGAQSGNNCSAIAGVLEDGIFTPGEGTVSYILIAQGENKYAIRTSDGQYLYAASSTANHLKKRDAIGDDGNALWVVTNTSAVACGTNRNVMQFNSGSSLFSCYGSASQTDIALYTRAKEKREGFTVGKLATVCVPYAVAQEDIIGADVYEIAGKNEAGKIVFDQVTTGGMVAGVAYLVQAKAETATFYYSGNAVAEPQNEGKALKGTFAEIDIAAADAANVYFFKDNALWSAKETGVKILAYRAWLDMSAVGNAGPSPAPGRRRITMDVHGENAATGMDELNASEAPRKMIIDGKMYILRGEKMYNANGILVK